MPRRRPLAIHRARPLRDLRIPLLSLPCKSGFLDLAVHSSGHPDEPDQACDDAVGDFAAAGVVGELETETAVDDADGDDDAAEPDVGVGPGGAAAVVLEGDVVDVAEEGLED